MAMAVSRVFPRRKKRTPGNRIPLIMRKLMRFRKSMGRRLALTRCPQESADLRQRLAVVEETITSSHNQFRAKEEEKAIARCKSDPGYFFKYTRKKSRLPQAVGPLAHPTGSLNTMGSSLSPLSPAP